MGNLNSASQLLEAFYVQIGKNLSHWIDAIFHSRTGGLVGRKDRSPS